MHSATNNPDYASLYTILYIVEYRSEMQINISLDALTNILSPGRGGI